MHDSAYKNAEKFVLNHLDKNEQLRIADIGSLDVNGTLKPLFDSVCWGYSGFDIAPGENVDSVLSSEYRWDEITDNSFDVIVSSQVLEHVRMPWLWIKEIVRICKCGGLIFIDTPNTIGFHEYPLDCWRVWPDGMRSLFEWARIDAVEIYANGMDTVGIGRKV